MFYLPTNRQSHLVHPYFEDGVPKYSVTVATGDRKYVHFADSVCWSHSIISRCVFYFSVVLKPKYYKITFAIGCNCLDTKTNLCWPHLLKSFFFALKTSKISRKKKVQRIQPPIPKSRLFHRSFAAMQKQPLPQGCKQFGVFEGHSCQSWNLTWLLPHSTYRENKREADNKKTSERRTSKCFPLFPATSRFPRGGQNTYARRFQREGVATKPWRTLELNILRPYFESTPPRPLSNSGRWGLSDSTSLWTPKPWKMMGFRT